MGTNKLLLPYRGTTVIEHVLSQWTASRVDYTLVVLNHEDQRMIDIGHSKDVICVVPETVPIEMKHSVGAALAWIQQNKSPRPNDAWLLAPADLPGLSTAVIDSVIESYDPGAPTIIVPRHRRRRGHPAMFPWSYSVEVDNLAGHQGVNSLLERHDVYEVPTDDSEMLHDMDTPDDYQRASNDKL